jgi:hypothetical protein
MDTHVVPKSIPMTKKSPSSYPSSALGRVAKAVLNILISKHAQMGDGSSCEERKANTTILSNPPSSLLIRKSTSSAEVVSVKKKKVGQGFESLVIVQLY